MLDNSAEGRKSDSNISFTGFFFFFFFFFQKYLFQFLIIPLKNISVFRLFVLTENIFHPTPWEFFPTGWHDSKSPRVCRTLLSILADHAVMCMMSVLTLISNTSSFHSKHTNYNSYHHQLSGKI